MIRPICFVIDLLNPNLCLFLVLSFNKIKIYLLWRDNNRFFFLYNDFFSYLNAKTTSGVSIILHNFIRFSSLPNWSQWLSFVSFYGWKKSCEFMWITKRKFYQLICATRHMIATWFLCPLELAKINFKSQFGGCRNLRYL